MKLRALERPRVPIPVLGDKLTVWYESGGQVAAWRGGVVRLRRDGAEMLVSFDAMPPHHADKEKWIEIAEDEWALGSHWCRNPSGAQIVEACAKARGASKAAAAASKAADAAVAAAASLAATATTLIAAATVMAPTGSTVVDTSASPHEMTTMCAVPISYAVALSGRAWPPQFAAGLYELACLHENMARAGWVSYHPSLALYVAVLDERGITGIVNVGISLLSRIPPSHWRPTRRWWNVSPRGAWSQPLATAHTPELLAAILAAARHRVVLWPASVTAVNAKANQDPSANDDHDPTPIVSKAASARTSSAPLAADDAAHRGDCGPRGGLGGACCFVCCNQFREATFPHPKLRGHVLCDACAHRYQRQVRTVDSELLEQHCVACGLTGGAVHGCWTCGGSLCERCLFLLHGSGGLLAARTRRLDCTVCPGCHGRDDPHPDPPDNAEEASSYVLCCDDCRQEWHPRCRMPPVSRRSALGGASARWSCFHCAVSGPPKTPAWSMHACGACRAVRLDGRLQHLALASEDVRPFAHAAELSALNERIEVANAALRASSLSLDAEALARLARDGERRNGLTIVSVCDGKGTLLGILLGAGVRVRRYVSVECDEHARRVCRAHYGGAAATRWSSLAPDALRFVGDATALSVVQLRDCDAWPVHLLAGSTPCDDISGCNERASQLGMEAEHSRLLFDFTALFRTLLAAGNDGVPLALFYENVVPASTRDRNALRLAFDGLPVLESEGAIFEAARRPRSLVANFAFARVPEDTQNIRLQDVLNPGAVALADKAGCIVGGTLSAHGETVATARAHSRRNRGRELVLCSASGTDVRGLLVAELAKALGQPFYEVDAAGGGEQLRAGLLGRSFAVGQIRHALGALIRACVCDDVHP